LQQLLEELEDLREQASQEELEELELQPRELEQFISRIAILACFLKDFLLLQPFLHPEELDDDEHLELVAESSEALTQHFFSLTDILETSCCNFLYSSSTTAFNLHLASAYAIYGNDLSCLFFIL